MRKKTVEYKTKSIKLLGELLNNKRKRLNLDFPTLGKEVGVPSQILWRLWAKQTLPGTEHLGKILAYVGVSFDLIFNNKGAEVSLFTFGDHKQMVRHFVGKDETLDAEGKKFLISYFDFIFDKLVK